MRSSGGQELQFSHMAITKKLKMNVDDENEMGEAVFENQDAANACNVSDTLSFITSTLKALSICSCDLVGCEYYAILLQPSPVQLSLGSTR